MDRRQFCMRTAGVLAAMPLANAGLAQTRQAADQIKLIVRADDIGSAHAANLFSATARLQWLSGGDKVTTYALPATRHTRCFCPICGSALPHAAGEFLAVPAGSLDTDVRRRPDAHIFVTSRASWDKALEDIPAHETFPE